MAFQRVRSRLDVLFGIDVRSLALARVLTAALLLVDLVQRATDLSAHYGAGSVFPAELLRSGWRGDWSWSLHLWSGGPMALVAALFVVQALVALALLLGYRTKLATFVSWFLLFSLHNANPLLLYGGDALLRAILFVGMFLPWGEAYAVDRALRVRAKASPRVLSGWSAAFLLQIGLLYFSTAALKSGFEWREGSAIYYALSLDQYTTSLGALLPHALRVSEFLTYAVLGLEFGALFLLFSPIFTNPLRLIALPMLFLLHLGILLTMHVGLFSPLMIAALVAFVPSDVWNWLEEVLGRRFGNIAIYYDGECGFCRSSSLLFHTFLALPRSIVTSAQSDQGILRDMRAHDSWVVVDRNGGRHFEFDAFITLAAASPFLFWLVPLFRTRLVSSIGGKVYRFVANHRSRTCAPILETPRRRSISPVFLNALGIVYVFYVFVWQLNYSPLTQPYIHLSSWSWWDVPAKALGIDQYWDMFSQSPLDNDAWPIVAGTLRNGEQADLFRNNAPLSFEKPGSVVSITRNIRWRKFTSNLRFETAMIYREYYAAYLCRNWNEKHFDAKHLETVELISMYEKTPLPYESYVPAEPVSLLNWKCA